MKALMVLFGVTAAVAAVWALAFFADRRGEASPPVATTPPQHLTLKVLNDSDQMAGPKLLMRPGRVVLTIVNYARHAHTFSAPGLGVEQVVVPGSPTHPSRTVVRFMARHGWFPWFCRFPCDMGGAVYVSSNPPRLHGPLWANATT